MIKSCIWGDNMINEVTFEMIKDAYDVLKEVVHDTPILSSHRLSPTLFFKAEDTQRTGSFKIRGAYNRVKNLTKEEASRGVIGCSAGNHAQGLALAATKYGIKSVICMPANAPEIKVNATKGYGAEVVLVDGNYDDAAKEAERLSKEKGYTFVHPFNDPYVIAGQGTIGIDILKQVPDVEQILVPVGGGGLLSGVAIAVKNINPKCKVIGVEPSAIPSVSTSLKNGKITTIPDATSVADGLHVRTPGDLTFEIIKKYVDDVITVDEDMIYAAMVALLTCPKIVAEGAGATPVAAYMYKDIDRSKKTVCIVSGGNVDFRVLDLAIKKGEKKFEEYIQNHQN